MQIYNYRASHVQVALAGNLHFAQAAQTAEPLQQRESANRVENSR